MDCTAQTKKEGTNSMEQVFTNMTGGGPVSVYVEDGKITRVRPLQIPESDFPKPWVIEGNDGKKYSPQGLPPVPPGPR